MKQALVEVVLLFGLKESPFLLSLLEGVEVVPSAAVVEIQVMLREWMVPQVKMELLTEGVYLQAERMALMGLAIRGLEWDGIPL